MKKKDDFFSQVKNRAQKAQTVIKKTVKKVVDESGLLDDTGLSTKEGREELLKKAQDFANKTKNVIQETAQQGTAATKKAFDRAYEKAQQGTAATKRAFNQAYEKAQERKTQVTENLKQKKAEKEKAKRIKEAEMNAMASKVTTKRSLKGPVILAACAAVGGAGIGAGVADSGETHCAFFSLEDEYNLMRACVNSCGSYNVSKCAERIRQFECSEKESFHDAEQTFRNSCSLRSEW